jgi:hypothetical protein
MTGKLLNRDDAIRLPLDPLKGWKRTGLVLVLLGWTSLAHAACPPVHRSQAVLLAFQRAHPCPANGQQTGACPGWVRDHRWPLCAGGADSVENLVWAPADEAKLKDVWEKTMCRRLCTAQ